MHFKLIDCLRPNFLKP